MGTMATRVAITKPGLSRLTEPVRNEIRAAGATEDQTQMFLAYLPFLEVLSDNGAKAIGAALAMGVGGIGPALAIGMLVGKAMEALGRNPEARGAVQTNMILGVAFAEAIGIYALLTAIIVAFVV